MANVDNIKSALLEIAFESSPNKYATFKTCLLECFGKQDCKSSRFCNWEKFGIFADCIDDVDEAIATFIMKYHNHFGPVENPEREKSNLSYYRSVTDLCKVLSCIDQVTKEIYYGLHKRNIYTFIQLEVMPNTYREIFNGIMKTIVGKVSIDRLKLTSDKLGEEDIADLKKNFRNLGIANLLVD